MRASNTASIWQRLGLALLALQLVVASASAMAVPRPQLDAFGNPICAGIGESQPAGEPHRMPDCCFVACAAAFAIGDGLYEPCAGYLRRSEARCAKPSTPLVVSHCKDLAPGARPRAPPSLFV